MSGTGDERRQWDTNGEVQITCREAREHDIAPMHREHPAFGSCGTGIPMGKREW